MQTKNTSTVIRELDSLPPLDRQAQQLLAALSDPDLDTGMLVELLRLSPALAARILGIARSSFFAGPLPPRDLADAVIRFLGLALVRDLSIAFTLSTPLRSERCRRFQPLRYWRHALLTASLSEQLAIENKIPHANQAYLAGLLHNLGLFALVHVAPARMQEVFEQVERSGGRGLSDVERDLLGVDHCRAGKILADAWRLPQEIADVMSFHRDRRYLGRHWELVTLTGLAERYCSSINASGVPSDEELHRPLHQLHIDRASWDQAITAWQPRVRDIAELARQFR